MKGLKIARIFGIPIKIHWSWIIIFGLLAFSAESYIADLVPNKPAVVYWFAGAGASIILFASLIFHELSHSLVWKCFGKTVKGITLFILGGVAQGDSIIFERPKEEFLVGIAGPVSSTIAAGIFYAIGRITVNILPEVVLAALFWLIMLNLVLVVFNAVPIFPMDGGRVFRSLYWWRTGILLKATKAAYYVGVVFSVILCLASILIYGVFSAIWVGLILWFFILPLAQSEYRQVQRSQ